MTPRQFLRHYKYDQRLITGAYYSSSPLTVEKGDTIGVVLLNLGGPEEKEEIQPFLYSLFMDPAIIDMPIRGVWRHWLAAFIAKTRAGKVASDYAQIGGSPINRLSTEQAEALEEHLNEAYGQTAGVTFKTYLAMRYWKPSSEEAVEQMEADGVNKVVLLPLYPHYSKTTTGSSLMYWWMLEEHGEMPSWPTTYVYEYAANPSYIRAISERIDEGLQRFERDVRDDVHILFSAHGTPLREMKERRDPYCCLIHRTVDQVMAFRQQDRPFHISFQSKVGPAEWLTPSTPDKLKEMAEAGHTAVLVVPVAFVSDHVETQFELDIEIREEAEEFGIHHYEVMTGLNDHPLFIRSLGEAARAQLIMQDQQVDASGDGAPALGHQIVSLDQMPVFESQTRGSRCHQCEHITDARCWVGAETSVSTPSESES